MRNFKKFLALVLAMLMVSACAVSVSAAFDDQADIVAAKANDAVNTLVDLGVISGRGDGKFYPNDTLTREEACVIFAKLRAGAEGQKYEWAEETTVFTDVVDKWSFAYINYAFRNGFMVGVGEGKFNPKGVLTIEQALCAAVKAYKGSTNEKSGIQLYAERVEAVGEHAYWAGHWTDIAVELGLTEKVPFNYTANCSRATMAQIAYNLFSKDVSIKNAFNLVTLEGELSVVAKDTATVAGATVVRTVFENALAASGFEGALTDYIGAKFTITYDRESLAVYSAALKSDMMVFDSTDAILSINKDANGAYTNTLTFSGKTYRANNLGADGSSGMIGGAGAYQNISIEYRGAYLDSELAENGTATLNGLPTYYKGFAYDDNSDGNYDRLVIKEYKLATIKANTATAANGITFDTVSFMKLGDFTNKDRQSDKAPIAYTGEVAAKIDEKTPNLVHISYNAGTNSYIVDVLEVATLKSGLLTGITKDVSVTIDGDTLKYNAEFEAPASTTLEQNVSVWTIYGTYIKFSAYASIDTSAKTLLVESVKIVDGNAIVTGYNVKKGYAKEELTVVGVAGDKLVDYAAFRPAATATKAAGLVYLAEAEGKTAKVTFNDAYTYDFTITDKGAYVDVDSAADFVEAYRDARGAGFYHKLSIKNGYLMYAEYSTNETCVASAIAQAEVNAPVVVKITNTDETNDIYNNWTMTISTSLSEIQKVQARLVKDSNGKVTTVIYGQASVSGTTIIASPIAEGQTIVQVIADAHEYGFAADVYKAVDIINGKVVNVTGTAKKGEYYVANTADYKLVGEKVDNLWVLDNIEDEEAGVDNKVSNIVIDKSGILYTVNAFNTQLEKALNVEDAKYAPVVAGDNKAFSTVNQIKVYVAKDGIITTKDNGANPVTEAAADFVKKHYENAKAAVTVDAGYAYTYNKTVAYGIEETEVTFKTADTYVVDGTMIIVCEVTEKVLSKTYNKLPAGTIVKVLAEGEEEGTYEAFDLFAEEIVTVTSEEDLVINKFYVAEGGVVADDTATKWIRNGKAISVADEEGKYVANAVYFVDDATTPSTYADEEYTAEQISIFEIVDGEVTELDAADVIGEDTKFTAYCVKGQIIIVK